MYFSVCAFLKRFFKTFVELNGTPQEDIERTGGDDKEEEEEETEGSSAPSCPLLEIKVETALMSKNSVRNRHESDEPWTLLSRPQE